MGFEPDPPGLAALLHCCLSARATPLDWRAFAERTQPLIAPAVVRGLRQFGATPTRELVDDLVQDTYLRLCEHNFAALRRFRSERPEALIAYLKIAACNVARDYARAALTEKRGAGRVTADDDEMTLAADPSTERAALDAAVLVGEIDRHLSTGDAAARTRDRAIFWLYYRQGLTARAISEIPSIGLSQKGVESTIYRLTRAVRELFATRVPPPEGDRVEKAST